MTRLELDRFNAYRDTIIFEVRKEYQHDNGCRYTVAAINSPAGFRQYSFHAQDGQAQEEIDALINEAKNFITKTILSKI